jgi:SAM-dependent methyltransferase
LAFLGRKKKADFFWVHRKKVRIARPRTSDFGNVRRNSRPHTHFGRGEKIDLERKSISRYLERRQSHERNKNQTLPPLAGPVRAERLPRKRDGRPRLEAPASGLIPLDRPAKSVPSPIRRLTPHVTPATWGVRRNLSEPRGTVDHRTDSPPTTHFQQDRPASQPNAYSPNLFHQQLVDCPSESSSGRPIVTHRAGDWFEFGPLWAETFPFMFPESSFVDAAASVPKIVALSRVAGGSVLDLACGPGRYAIPLAQAGYAVTGVDSTRFLLDRARERAERAGTKVEWVEHDMRTFLRPAAFDLAINVYTSFGYFEDPAENRRVLDNILASLKPGGVFVFDHLGKQLLAARLVPTRSDALPDGRIRFARQTVTKDWTHIEAEWVLVEGDRASTFRLRHWLYSGQEIRELLTAAGFVDISLSGSFDGIPYDPQASRLVAVARKPA